jgi:hypothetical protein
MLPTAMVRYANAIVTVLVTAGACTWPLSCGGQTCSCQGDVCKDCSATTRAAPAPDAGEAEAAMGDTDVADATIDGLPHDAPNENATAVTDATIDADCCLDGASAGDGNSAEDVGDANRGGPGCISGCSRGTITCASADPPVGWRCDGPGTNSSARFVEAGCTSLPINSIAWCCPSAFLSQCACMPGQDSTCNDDPAISSLHGTCQPDGTCSCILGSGLNPATGKCR